MNKKMNVKLMVKFTIPKWCLKVRYSVKSSCWHHSIQEIGTISNAYCEDKWNATNLIDSLSDTEY